MEKLRIQAERRKDLGTRPARHLREQGRLPAVIYGHGQTPETIVLSEHEFVQAVDRGARTMALDVEGSASEYLIKDVQYDHLGKRPIHVDLMRVNVDERVKVQVGIELRGVPKGVSEGGVLDQALASLEIECRALAIPETLRPRVSDLQVGDTLYVKDLELPDGVTPLTDGDEIVAAVRILAEEAEEEETPSEETSTQPERIGRAREEEAGSGDSSSS